ncbi:hypothetical protein [Roseovarius sp. D22-M7]|uniref:hypothetical protein n=1 Tax=Roseovarius sp. D22-M7 TaxID=3127116 RepID=UPI00300FFD04
MLGDGTRTKAIGLRRGRKDSFTIGSSVIINAKGPEFFFHRRFMTAPDPVSLLPTVRAAWPGAKAEGSDACRDTFHGAINVATGIAGWKSQGKDGVFFENKLQTAPAKDTRPAMRALAYAFLSDQGMRQKLCS